jgi:hypothetical protein
MLWKRITVFDFSRVVVSRNNQFVGVMCPGEHTLFAPPFVRFDTELYSFLNPIFESRWAAYIISSRPDVLAEHFRKVETSHQEIAFISVSGKLRRVLWPQKQLLLWKEAENVTVDVVNVMDAPEAPDGMLRDFERLETGLGTPSLALSDPRDDDSSSQGGVFDLLSFENKLDES